MLGKTVARSVLMLVSLLAALLVGAFFWSLWSCQGDGCIFSTMQQYDSIHTFSDCAAHNFPIMESYPRQCRLPDGRVLVEEVTVSSSSSSVAVQPNIIVTQPWDGQTLGNSFDIKGQARVFENQFSYFVRDASGSVIAQGSAMANSPDVGQFGSFVIHIKNLKAKKGSAGMVEVFDYSAKDGSQIDLVQVPVVFSGK